MSLKSKHICLGPFSYSVKWNGYGICESMHIENLCSTVPFKEVRHQESVTLGMSSFLFPECLFLKTLALRLGCPSSGLPKVHNLVTIGK